MPVLPVVVTRSVFFPINFCKTSLGDDCPRGAYSLRMSPTFPYLSLLECIDPNAKPNITLDVTHHQMLINTHT